MNNSDIAKLQLSCVILKLSTKIYRGINRVFNPGAHRPQASLSYRYVGMSARPQGY